MSSTLLKRKLLLLLSAHGRLCKQLLRHQRVLRGSFHQVYTRCGKSNCWCATAKKGHPHARLTWSQDGRMMTRKVSAAEKKTVTRLTQDYRKFSEQRRKLIDLESAIQDRLNQYEKALTNQTRNALALGPQASRISAKTKSAMQTRRPRRN